MREERILELIEGDGSVTIMAVKPSKGLVQSSKK